MIDFPNALSYYEDMKVLSVPPSTQHWQIPLMKDCPGKDLCLARFTRNIQVLSSFFHLLICLSFIRHLLIVLNFESSAR